MSHPRFARADDPVPTWRRNSALVSVSLHAAVGMAWLLIAAVTPAVTRMAETPASRTIARIEVPPLERPLLIERAISPDELSGYDISGLPFNLAKIDARRQSLFPFLTGDLTFLDRMAGDFRAAGQRLGNPLDAALNAKPLSLAPQLLQQFVDEAWSRRERWRRFEQIRALVLGHDAHEGDAPALVRAYLDQNLLQPYCHGRMKDGQFWALLENATEHVDFLEFIRSYARARSSSRVTTELLFLMDELAQGNQEVAETVLETSVATDLAYSATVSPSAAKLAASIHSDLRTWVASNGYTQLEGVGPAFDAFRLRLLSTIVETTPDGYRASDARFLAGQIFFRRGDVDQALEWWSLMRPAPNDSYVVAATALRGLLGADGPGDVAAIRSVLWRERARNDDLISARMRQFGYRCDNY